MKNAQTQTAELLVRTVQEAHDAVEEAGAWLEEYLGTLVAGNVALAATYEADLLSWAGLVAGRVRRVVMEARAATRPLRRQSQTRDARGRFVRKSD